MIRKENPHRITVPEMAPHVHSFKADENKVDKISKWLMNWIDLSLDCGKIKPYDFLPSKADLAFHIGVSQGTMQNVFRRLEDFGYIESKQKIGSYIKNKNKNNSIEKLTSKREMATEIVKKYIAESGYNNGDKLISIRQLSEMLGMPNTTLRLAVMNLVNEGILVKKEKTFIIKKEKFTINKVYSKTLVEKIAENIENYISENLKAGDILPPNHTLSKRFNVSIKTIHDSLKLLSKKGIIYTRRGRYGTMILGNSDSKTPLYQYEKTEQKIRQYISTNCKEGDKLPAIKIFAKEFNTSEKTIKKALDNLAEDGYLTFSRGRYGGTFVIDIPQTSTDAYKWLAISTDYMSN